MLGADLSGVPYTNMRDTARRLVREEGLRALWSGLWPRTWWMTLGGFVFFGAYETAAARLRAHRGFAGG